MASIECVQRGPEMKRKDRLSSRSLGEFYLEKLQQHNTKVALVQQVDSVEVSVTYSELLRHGKIVSGLLREHGLGSGDTVMLLCGNTLQFAPIMLGTFFTGAALASVNPTFNTSDMLHMINVIKPQVVICNEQAESYVQEALTQYNTPVVFITMEAVKKRLKEDPDVEDFYLGKVEDPDTHVAFVMCSSGTTGKPKGVEITQSMWLLRTSFKMFLVQNECNDQQDVFINTSGPHWLSCLVTTTYSLNHGNKLCLLAIVQCFKPDEYLQIVERYKVNHTVLGPDMIIALAKYPSTEKYALESLRSILYAGAPVSNAMVIRAQEKLRCKIASVYGMTECMGLTPEYDQNCTLGNVGKPLEGTEIKVVDVDTGLLLGPNNKGEIRVKTWAIFKCYRGNPEATKDAFDNDGYFCTGDLGHYDENGYFYITDRLKETFKYKGIFVTTSDIEEVLLQHDDVSQAAVVGIFNEIDCTHATAFVVRRTGATVSEQQLIKLVEESLPNYKWLPGGVHFVESLPRTPSGKFKKFEMKTNFENTQRLNKP